MHCSPATMDADLHPPERDLLASRPASVVDRATDDVGIFLIEEWSRGGDR